MRSVSSSPHPPSVPFRIAIETTQITRAQPPQITDVPGPPITSTQGSPVSLPPRDAAFRFLLSQPSSGSALQHVLLAAFRRCFSFPFSRAQFLGCTPPSTPERRPSPPPKNSSPCASGARAIPLLFHSPGRRFLAILLFSIPPPRPLPAPYEESRWRPQNRFSFFPPPPPFFFFRCVAFCMGFPKAVLFSWLSRPLLFGAHQGILGAGSVVPVFFTSFPWRGIRFLKEPRFLSPVAAPLSFPRLTRDHRRRLFSQGRHPISRSSWYFPARIL